MTPQRAGYVHMRNQKTQKSKDPLAVDIPIMFSTYTPEMRLEPYIRCMTFSIQIQKPHSAQGSGMLTVLLPDVPTQFS